MYGLGLADLEAQSILSIENWSRLKHEIPIETVNDRCACNSVAHEGVNKCGVPELFVDV